MSRLSLSVGALVLLGLAQAASVQGQSGAGYGVAQDPAPAYYPPPQPPVNYYQVPIFVPPPRPPLIHTHICKRDVGYATYGGKDHYRSRHPKERTCDDVYMPTGSGSNRKTANKNCNHCCKNAARLNGSPIESIRGMILIEDDKRRCTCCAPATSPATAIPYSYPVAAAAPAVGSGAYPSAPAADMAQPVADYSSPPAAAPATGY